MSILEDYISKEIKKQIVTDIVVVGYSINNRKFSKEWFLSVGSACKNNNSKLVVVIVDEPYAHNSAARIGIASPLMQELDHYRKIGDQRAVMVKRVLNNISGLKFDILRWKGLEASDTVDLFRQELSSALNSSNNLKSILLSYVSRWTGIDGKFNERFLGFLLDEIPVFSALYFSWNYVIDVYPGENFNLYYQLPLGTWKNVLPLMSKYSFGKQLVCINTLIDSD